jgi:uncharacterized integral membrane protein (TIGR00698 family)
MSTTNAPSFPARASATARLAARAPGVAACLLAAAASYGLSLLLPGTSPLLIAIVLGIVVANVVPMPAVVAPGVDFSAKQLLRVGIVLLGLQLSLADIAALRAPMLGVVVTIVALGIGGTLLLGRMLGVAPRLRLLIACGFSICGAAAVAATAGVTDPDDEHEEDTVTAVALVVLFGTALIFALPALAGAFGFNSTFAGMWAGGATHEIAQVVAIGGTLGGGALAVAVLVKLARVLLLAPVMAVVSLRERRRVRAAAGRDAEPGASDGPKLPPIVPWFVAGFLALVLVRSFVPIPDAALSIAQVLQTGLLAAAMFGLGCGVRFARLARVGLRPFALATASTVLVGSIALGGVALVA